MRLTVADLDGDDDPRSFAIACPSGFTDDTASILYLPIPAAQRLRSVDNVIVALPAWMLRNHLTVVGVHPWRQGELDEDALDDIASRVPGAPVYVLSHEEGEPRLLHARGGKIEALNEAEIMAELRRADVLSIVQTDGAHLPRTQRFHYQGPNGHHYDAILRPGFAMTTNNRLDRISFWLLPTLRGRTNIVVDHWSMLTLAHHAAAYAARAFCTEPNPYIEVVAGYESSDTLTPRLRRAFPTATEDEALFLLSINSSGSMAHDVVLPALGNAAQKRSVAVALASSSRDGDRKVDALVDLDEEFHRYEIGDCRRCDEATALIPIQKSTYLMKLAAYTQLTAISKEDANLSRDVIEAYKDCGAFSLHRTHLEAGDDRHHAFYVDLLPMLTKQRFGKRLLRAVGGLNDIEPSVIICPPSKAAQELAKAVAGLLGLDIPIVSDERGLTRLSEEQVDRLCEATDILLVDDVVITGRRIEGFRQELISMRRLRGLPSDFNLGCLVGVARARDPKALQGCKDFVHHRTGVNETFVAVETIFLPNWDERQCPWCLEFQALDRLTGPSSELAVVKERLAKLDGIGGLADPFFTPLSVSADEAAGASIAPEDETAWRKLSEQNDATSDYADSYWDLNPGSVFGDVQGVDLVVSIAAAVHALRFKYGVDLSPQEPRLDSRFRSPIAKVLDPSLYLFGRFYEPVLLASILRVCNPWDLSSPDIDDDLVDGVSQHLEYLASGKSLMGEAIVLGRLDRLPGRAIKALPQVGSELAVLADALL